ncbi:MAG: TadE family protein [Pontixanthobacter sp.]
MIMPTFLKRLRRDADGVTVVEFAIVAPVLCLMLMGMFDLGFQRYAQTVIKGAIQEAGRSSSLEPTLVTTTELDDAVRNSVLLVVPGAKVTFERKNYATFGDVRKMEEYRDTNKNGVCDDGEPFDDLNGNGTRDDRGRDGVGGARDAVLYTAIATYPRVFPLHGFVDGLDAEVTVSGQTVLRNQPYDEQAVRVREQAYCDA